MAQKGTKRCCVASSVVILLLIIAVVLILCFTVFKPKQPQIKATPVSIERIKFTLFPTVTLLLSLDVDILIRNPNYAGFKYENFNTSIYYRGDLVGHAPVAAGEIGARSSETVTAAIDVEPAKVVANRYFLSDAGSGSLNLTSYSGLKGKVIILGTFKLHATISVSCDIIVFLLTNTTTTSCKSDIKI